MKEMMNKLKRFLYNIKNIYEWSKILWDDFDWDYDFLLKILDYKLKKMRKYFDNSNITTVEEYQSILNEIDTCINAIEQLRNRDYIDEIYKEYYDKYPTTIESWIDEQRNVVHGIKMMNKERKKLFDIAYKKEKNKENELNHMLFDTIRDNYEKWWD